MRKRQMCMLAALLALFIAVSVLLGFGAASAQLESRDVVRDPAVGHEILILHPIADTAIDGRYVSRNYGSDWTLPL
ncbi:MAG: hypothetical protein H5T69_13040, partial [Chloroflexi bacterium]|nr:hypothetical protein [Chloroflexota bacterium]